MSALSASPAPEPTSPTPGQNIGQAWPVDYSRFKPTPEELAWLKKETGIHDDENLRKHVFKTMEEGIAIIPYPCFKLFAFATYKIGKHPAYNKVLALGKDRPGAIYLEMGCCFGNDIRKVISDGYPAENTLGVDLMEEFWKIGHKFFGTSPETFPVTFLTGDIFDPSFLKADLPTARTSSSQPSAGMHNLSSLRSLTPLQHHVSIIHAAALFHLFDESKQRRLAFLLGSLLSPLSGSMILGSHRAITDTEENRKGGFHFEGMAGSNRKGLFSHSPTSWKELWVGEGGVFEEEDAKVWAVTNDMGLAGFDEMIRNMGITVLPKEEEVRKGTIMVWSVTRI